MKKVGKVGPGTGSGFGDCVLWCGDQTCDEPSPLLATNHSVINQDGIVVEIRSVIGLSADTPMTCIIGALIEPPLNPADCTPPLEGTIKTITVEFRSGG